MQETVAISKPEPIDDDPPLRVRTRWRQQVLDMPVNSQLTLKGVDNRMVRTFVWRAGHKLGRTYRTSLKPENITIVRRLS